MHFSFIQKTLSFICLCISPALFAVSYPIPSTNQSLIGEIQIATTGENDNVISIAKKYNVGFNALTSANPHLDMKRGFLPETMIIIPTQHLLPEGKREGIIINAPEMRMYYFPKNSQDIETYPIGIGKMGNTIPMTTAKIIRKTENPTWIPTKNIRQFNLEQGIVLPKVMGAGPDNPLGRYAIYTSLPTYLIHSTIFPESIGKRASFGCIRMYENDIERFFSDIEKNVPVYIINTPIKFGFNDNKLYMEVHKPLEEYKNEHNTSLSWIVDRIIMLTKNGHYLIDWQLVSYIAAEKDGMPHQIGTVIE